MRLRGFVISLAMLVGLGPAGCSRNAAAPASDPLPARAAPAVAATAKAAGDAVEGQRVARRVGCTGCHGENGAGEELWSTPGKYIVRSANLTEKRALYDDAGLHALLGQGRTHDGHAPFGMPIFMLQRMSVRERTDVIAWLRALPAVSNPALKASWLSDETRRQIADGSFPEDDYLADPGVASPPDRPREPLALGQYLAMSSCTECHGRDLRGWSPDDPAPSLVVAKAYTPGAFKRLMREGITAAGVPSKTGFMTAVAKQRFAGLHDEEIAALKAWLDARAP